MHRDPSSRSLTSSKPLGLTGELNVTMLADVRGERILARGVVGSSEESSEESSESPSDSGSDSDDDDPDAILAAGTPRT